MTHLVDYFDAKKLSEHTRDVTITDKEGSTTNYNCKLMYSRDGTNNVVEKCIDSIGGSITIEYEPRNRSIRSRIREIEK